MTIAVPRSSATILLVAAIGNCTVVNDLKYACGDSGRTVELGGEAESRFFEEAGAVVGLDDGSVLVTYSRNRSGPFSAEGGGLGMTVLATPGLSVLERCGSTSLSQSRDEAPPGGAPTRVSSPHAVRTTSSLGSTTLVAYRRSPVDEEAVAAAGPGDEVRALLLDQLGCPAVTDWGTEPFTVSEDLPERRLTQIQVAPVALDRFALVWLSADRNPRLFDDRFRARLVSRNAPRFPANAGSPFGATVDLDVPGRWLAIPRVITLPPKDGIGRFGLVWYERSARSGVVFFAAFDEQLRRISEIVEIDRDQDADVALQVKRVDGVFDPSSDTVALIWTRGVAGSSEIQLLGRFVSLETQPRLLGELRFDHGPGQAAWSPSAAFLGRDLFVSWRQTSGVPGTSAGRLHAVLLRPSGEARFTRAACSDQPFPVAGAAPAEPRLVSVAQIGGNAVAMSWPQERVLPGGSFWSLGVTFIERDDLVPRNWKGDEVP